MGGYARPAPPRMVQGNGGANNVRNPYLDSASVASERASTVARERYSELGSSYRGEQLQDYFSRESSDGPLQTLDAMGTATDRYVGGDLSNPTHGTQSAAVASLPAVVEAGNVAMAQVESLDVIGSVKEPPVEAPLTSTAPSSAAVSYEAPSEPLPKKRLHSLNDDNRVTDVAAVIADTVTDTALYPKEKRLKTDNDAPFDKREGDAATYSTFGQLLQVSEMEQI